MTWKHPDYYAVLGVGRGASAAEVDRAYRRAARSTHPDVHPDDASAAERFRAVAIAHETLSDPGRRAAYDRAHPAVRQVGEPGRVGVRRNPRLADVPPVQLGRRPPEWPAPRLVQPTPVADDLFELVEAIARMFVAPASRQSRP